MPHFTRHLNILAMPTDACNMNCVYCFHKPYHASVDKMNIATVKRLLDITAPYYEGINFIWHGGEPLIMGLDFYKEVIKLEREYACKIKNSIQSNLTLLTEKMADFFIANEFNLSTSFDGVCNSFTRGCDEKIMHGRKLIVDRGKKCGIIMVVSSENINSLIESYRFFNDKNINFSLNLYLHQKEVYDDPLSLDPKDSVKKINELFDFWFYDKTGRISIRYFSNILEYILLRKKSICTYTSCLGRWVAVRYDGEIVPCNRAFPDRYSFGNVNQYSDIGEAFDSVGFRNLLQDAIIRRNKCKECSIFDFCNGGCNNVALNENGVTNNMGLSCEILIGVYNHIHNMVDGINVNNIIELGLNPMLLKYVKNT